MNRRTFIRSLFAAGVAVAAAPLAKFLPTPETVGTLDFSQIESILLEHINPVLRQQFEDSQTLYSRFADGVAIAYPRDALDLPSVRSGEAYPQGPSGYLRRVSHRVWASG